MRTALRDSVRQRYGGRCGYCGVHDEEAGARLTIDHYQPRVRGGSDEDDNLVYACHACNEYKGDYWPEEAERRIIHPLNEAIEGHIVEQVDHVLIPLTERGQIHIAILKLNRPELIASRRRRWQIANEQDSIAALQRRFDTVEMQIERISELLTRLTGGIPATANVEEAANGE